MNARSIFKKFDELCVLVAASRPGIVIVTESWLHAEIPDDVLQLQNYDFYRLDRQHRRGGGLCVWVKAEFGSTVIFKTTPVFCEVMSILLPDLNLGVFAMYFPPNLTVDKRQEFSSLLVSQVDDLLNKYPDLRYMICGDVNDLETTVFEEQLILTNRVNSATRQCSTLDHIWISDNLKEIYDSAAKIGPPLSNSDHNSVTLDPNDIQKHENRTERIVFDFRKSHMQNFLSKLQKANFRLVYASNSVDTKCEALYDILYDAMAIIPRRTVIMTESDKPWITPLLKLMIEDRWRAFRSRNWPLFSHLKRKVRNEIIRAKEKWSQMLSQEGKSIWKVVREVSGSKSISRAEPNTDGADNCTDILRSLSQEYERCFNRSEDEHPLPLEDEPWSFVILPLTVFYELRKLKQKQSQGIDFIPARVLREGAYWIADALCHIFNVSLQERTFPTCWKYGLTLPIPKRRNPSLKDYRFITVNPIMSKILERIVLQVMKTEFLNNYGPSQHGFRPLGSTTSALVEIHDTVTSFLDNKEACGVRMSCLDLSKAYDGLQHYRLVNALRNLGFNNGFILWLRSYLQNRKNYVKLK